MCIRDRYQRRVHGIIINKQNLLNKKNKKMSQEKLLYFFSKTRAEGNRDLKPLLGGKGVGLAEMAKAGIPVPPGFTIVTKTCQMFIDNKNAIPESLLKEIHVYLHDLEKEMGKKTW
eukprot:TRINITY_DN85_c0_g1_i5.p3 TRINITY_DN85_c0_g1~~TRINITY_DN85_c0_g1_i5.p3  ORF type:complete len:116 (+),score=63.22 TRINITY_DN85_c0_g1_i5:68-415(+)